MLTFDCHAQDKRSPPSVPVRVQPDTAATPHSCGSGHARFNVLPDKSGVPAETMRLNFSRHQGAPATPRRIHFSSLTRSEPGTFETDVRQAGRTCSMRQPSFKRTTGQARARINIFVLVLVCLGLAAGAFWYYRHGREHGTIGMIGGTGSVVLSDSTKAVLKNLDSPVEIRFYSLLDQASVPAATFALADRINRLLAEYQQVAGGKISVTRHHLLSDADAASADGLKPFNLDKGDACYLGLSVICNGQKESFPQLSAEWEQALEFDLSRAIARLAGAKPTPKSLANPPMPDRTSIEEVKRAIPNVASVSVDEGTQILRDAALNDFKAAAGEMEIQVREAQQRLSDAQNSQSEAEQQAAMKHLQQVQLDQADKLKAVATRLQAQISAFEQMKAAPPAAK
jgi:hypothetical protein